MVQATHIYIPVYSSEGERSKINLVAKSVTDEGPSLSILPNGHLLTLTSHGGRQGDSKLGLHSGDLI